MLIPLIEQSGRGSASRMASVAGSLRWGFPSVHACARRSFLLLGRVYKPGRYPARGRSADQTNIPQSLLGLGHFPEVRQTLHEHPFVPMVFSGTPPTTTAPSSSLVKRWTGGLQVR